MNINGSDTRFDDDLPSYTAVFPYFRRVGPYLQYFNSDANDNILTNDWKGPYFGFLNVIKTFRNTDQPRRTDPINVYFHFFAGQRESSLKALRQVLSWTQTQPIAPLFTSQFVRVEDGYIHAKIAMRKNRKGLLYRISNYGKDTTVRFEHAQNLYPDPDRSKGVIGYRHRLGSLYCYLDPDRSSAVLGLSPRAPRGVWLSRASGYIHLLSSPSPGEVDFVYDGWEPSDIIVWKGLAPTTPYKLVDSKLAGSRTSVYHSDTKGTIVLRSLTKEVRYRLVQMENF